MKSNNIQKMPKAGQAGNGTKPIVRSSAKFDCNCSLHGRQPMVALLLWAKVKLGCGCIWVRTDGEWIYEGNEPQ